MATPFFVIYDWMVKILNLAGTDLQLYALIYGFTAHSVKYRGSAKYLAERLNVNRDTIFNSIKRLQAKGLIHKSKPNTESVNYIEYQAVVPTEVAENLDAHTEITVTENPDTPTENPDTPYRNIRHSNKREMKVKEDTVKKQDPFVLFAEGNQALLNALFDYENMRNNLKKPMTDRAKELFCQKLQTFPKEHQIAVLEQSILNGWKDLYPLKADKGKTSAQIASTTYTPAEHIYD